MAGERSDRERRVSPGWGRRSVALDDALRAPLDAELARGRHVAEQGGRRDDRGAREVPQAADAHAVCPVAVEGGDRALALPLGFGALTATRPATGLPALRAGSPGNDGN